MNMMQNVLKVLKKDWSKTANQIKMGHGPVGEWTRGAGPTRANAKHLRFLLLSEKQMTSIKKIICEKNQFTP